MNENPVKIRVKIEKDADEAPVIEEYNSDLTPGKDRILAELIALKSKHTAIVLELGQLKEDTQALKSEKNVLIDQMRNNNKLIDILEADKKVFEVKIEKANETSKQINAEKDELKIELAALKIAHSASQEDIKSLKATIQKYRCGEDEKSGKTGKKLEKRSMENVSESQSKRIKLAKKTESVPSASKPIKLAKKPENVPSTSKPIKLVEKTENVPGTSDESMDSEDEDDFEVEMLLDHKRIKKTLQFLVRWKGCGSSDDTWVSQRDLNCPKLLESYLKEKKIV